MQYLGGMLIRSDLPLEELKTYYAQYAESEWDCIVERQSSQYIRLVEHGELTLIAKISEPDYYIVYAWGSSSSAFAGLDLRGH